MYNALARRTYRLLVRLYPAPFRREYGDDLVLLFDELITDRGTLAATTRTSIDLIVTVPRYHLEAVMTNSHAARTLNTLLAVLPMIGVIAVMAGFSWIGGLLILAGVALVLANRGRLARSIRTPDSSQRAHRLRMAALSAGVFAVCLVGYVVVIGDDEASTLGLVGTAIPGTAALVASACFLVAGLATPRTPATT